MNIDTGRAPATARHARATPGTGAPRPPRPRRLTRRIDRLDPALRRTVRRPLVLLLLLPVLLVLASRLWTSDAGLLGLYGLLALGGSVYLIHTAYTSYVDPATTGPAANDYGFPRLPPTPSVSLMVAVKDEAPFIERCVRSLNASDQPNLELIVVDDASTDGTTDILRALALELGFTLLVNDTNLGKKHALTRAVARARGDVLAFTDSDCLVAPDALSRCVRALVDDPRLGAVSGHARAQNTGASLLGRIQDVWYEGQFRIFKAAEATAGAVGCVSGPMAVFRRDAIYNYFPAWVEDRFLGAPFRFATDRQLTGYVLGQKWLGRKLKERHADSPFVTGVDYPERKWRVGYVRSARVTTIVPETLRALIRQQIRWKKSFIRSLAFTGRFMWRRGPRAMAIYYGHALLVLLAPFLAFRHLIWAPLHGMWLLTSLYVAGVALKGSIWALAYRYDHPGDSSWKYRVLMSLLSSTVLAWTLPYAAATVRRGIWSRGASA